MLRGCPVLEGRPVFEGCPAFRGCPMLEGCLMFGGCPNSEVSHGRSVSYGFGECPKDFKCKTNIFVLKINSHT